MKNIRILILIGLLVLSMAAACTPASAPVSPLPTSSATPPADAEIKSLPTPMSPKQVVVYDNMQVVMSQAEITASYPTEFGSNREPPAGKKFLWTHIILKNLDPKEKDLPAPEHFSALFGTTEFKPNYGHHKDHADYMALTTRMAEGHQVDAWLRFDISTDAELIDLIFAFLPESTQVSFGFSSSDYSWADHPIYLWTCAP